MPDDQLKLRIAVCDDELLIGLDFEDLIAGLGHEVCAVCGSAEDILQIAESDRPDLIVMDIKLGHDDGIETAGLILERHGIPSVLISGDWKTLESERAQRCKPLALLSKPVSEEAFEEALQRAITYIRQRR